MISEGDVAEILRDSQGTSFGVIAIVSRQPLTNIPLVETVLNIASARVAQELEAMHHLEALKLKDFTIENINDAVYWTTLDGRIWDVNSATLRLTSSGTNTRRRRLL